LSAPLFGKATDIALMIDRITSRQKVVTDRSYESAISIMSPPEIRPPKQACLEEKSPERAFFGHQLTADQASQRRRPAQQGAHDFARNFVRFWR
jgi:hypothetical protein